MTDKRPQWPTEQQRTNAKTRAAAAIRKHHHREPAEFDWDDAIARLEKMLDRIEDE